MAFSPSTDALCTRSAPSRLQRRAPFRWDFPASPATSVLPRMRWIGGPIFENTSQVLRGCRPGIPRPLARRSYPQRSPSPRQHHPLRRRPPHRSIRYEAQAPHSPPLAFPPGGTRWPRVRCARPHRTPAQRDPPVSRPRARALPTPARAANRSRALRRPRPRDRDRVGYPIRGAVTGGGGRKTAQVDVRNLLICLRRLSPRVEPTSAIVAQSAPELARDPRFGGVSVPENGLAASISLDRLGSAPYLSAPHICGRKAAGCVSQQPGFQPPPSRGRGPAKGSRGAGLRGGFPERWGAHYR
jgi:hypothetical protein